MKTVIEILTEQSKNISTQVKELFLTYSEIYLWNEPESSIVFTSGNHMWRELSDEGRQTQSKLLEDYKKHINLIRILLNQQPKDIIKKLEELDELIIRNIEQTGLTWIKTTREALDEVLNALNTISSFLNHLYSSGSGIIIVPDTNALLINPNIESWEYDDIKEFTIFLTPTVLSELDSHKINHRNPDIREKSIKLINQLKEYRRRGKLTDGVNIVKGKISLKSITTEPNFEFTLPWLDSQNPDDRLLASFIEIMRMNPKSIVLLATADINLQNKTEFVGLPFIEPPA